MKCPLCKIDGCAEVVRDRRRPYFLCGGCSLVFVPEAFHCTVDDERTRYDQHENTADNGGYVRFLTEVAEVAVAGVPREARILDLGCGKGAVLAGILEERGWQCDRYDPLYAYPLPPAGTRYDVIIMCEVIEHCREVAVTLRNAASLLADGGVLVIRTQCIPAGIDITRWWYAQDITHVNFFSLRALEKVADITGRSLRATAISDIFVVS